MFTPWPYPSHLRQKDEPNKEHTNTDKGPSTSPHDKAKLWTYCVSEYLMQVKPYFKCLTNQYCTQEPKWKWQYMICKHSILTSPDWNYIFGLAHHSSLFLTRRHMIRSIWQLHEVLLAYQPNFQTGITQNFQHLLQENQVWNTCNRFHKNVNSRINDSRISVINLPSSFVPNMSISWLAFPRQSIEFLHKVVNDKSHVGHHHQRQQKKKGQLYSANGTR